MAVSEIMGLLEIVRTLVSRKAELDKQYFDQFIQPMWDSFVNIHEDYKKSFKEYFELASEKAVPVGKLIAHIKRDAVYTADLRSELRKLIKYLPDSSLKTKSAYLSEFVEALIHYFHLEDEADMMMAFASSMAIALDNRRRGLAITEIERIETLKMLDAELRRIKEGTEPDIDAEQETDLFKNQEVCETDAKHEANIFKGYFDLLFDLQSDYDKVADAYFRIRKELLT